MTFIFTPLLVIFVQEAIPGVHWIELDLSIPAFNISKAVIDYESAYSNDYFIEVYCQNRPSWASVYKSKGGKRKVKSSKQHVIHEVSIVAHQTPCFPGMTENELDRMKPQITKIRLTINKPAERWGTSVWSFLVWGYVSASTYS